MGRSGSFLVTQIVLRGFASLGELPVLLERKSHSSITSILAWALSVRRNKPVSSDPRKRGLRHLGRFKFRLQPNRFGVRNSLEFVDDFTPNRIETSRRAGAGTWPVEKRRVCLGRFH